MNVVTIGKNKHGEDGLFARKDLKENEIIFELSGTITETPTKYSIQIGDNEHITDELGVYFNHSCEPNTAIDRRKRAVCATQAITQGEEITFDYNSNEAEMATPFMCVCGSPKCQGLISGYNAIEKRK